MPSQLGVWGLPPEKNQFCAKNYAIPSKFWYLFPILQHKNFQHAKIITSASEKVGGGGLSPSLETGGTYPPAPPAPTPMFALFLKQYCTIAPTALACVYVL